MGKIENKCESCIHARVCGRRGEYDNFLLSTVNALSNIMPDFVSISVGCKYYDKTVFKNQNICERANEDLSPAYRCFGFTPSSKGGEK